MARGMTASLAIPSFNRPKPAWTSPSNSVQGAYGAAVNQQAEDYDRIMSNYNSLLGNIRDKQGQSKINIQPLNYIEAPAYKSTGRLNEVANRLTNMSQTGGYSESDLSNIRARGVSPIRAIYANALRNVQRQKVLQGGYAPNLGAVTAKMAREQAGIIGDRMSAINADIAEKVAQGKQFATSQLAPIAQRESELINQSNTRNASERQRVNELNQKIMLEVERLNKTLEDNDISQQLAATQGMTQLYGTTPALTNTFGNQVLQSNAQNLAGQQATANVRQDRTNTGLNLVSRVAATPIKASIPTPIGVPSNNTWSLPSVRLGSAGRPVRR